MIYKNALVFVDGRYQKVDIEVMDGKFTAIRENISFGDSIDCSDKLILPGLIDIHTHGCVGYDFNNASASELIKMCDYYAKNGITSILATTMTIDYDTYKQAMITIHDTMTSNHSGSRIIGINMEGPFLGCDKKGAHDENYLLPLDLDIFHELNDLSGDAIRIVDMDPKLDNSIEFIKQISKQKTVSLAHTSCDYDLALKAIDAGASHITHMFNAMNGLHHRNPGLIGAFSDCDVHAEMICDGIHIHPSVIRMMFKVNADKMILISDSMRAAGLEDGIYELGGQDVYVKDQKATLQDGTIAGSTITVYQALKNVIAFGVPEEQAILSATLIPAKAIKADDEIGSISIGKKADFIILDKDYTIEKVYKDGLLL